ncbi:mannosyltransferase family protein [Chroococcus sp. FPU101]|uniref:mannosyltransferase family protein n=1 Tax=Chroococcus sp. FPU101 TaxID=1974212 RepID=UPI001A8C4D0E|nr:mannosyltransferase family protein [Chroococcus sp. FPU101]GFE69605.1 hypothetical protein CFPU101_22150 [Chroococcus sp. FPU101]
MAQKNLLKKINLEIDQNAQTLKNEFIFVMTIWLLSRLLIVIAMLFIGFGISHSGWANFANWDGNWYRKIATIGYSYANDGQQHSIAFFPLFPLATRLLMSLGLSFEVAGILVNNLSFLGALLLLYSWVKKLHGTNTAKWATAVLTLCPFSLFGTVIYTEGLFLLLTILALRAFEEHHYAWATLWGAMATATRATGCALVPTFLIVAWKERRPPIAYVVGLATTVGLLFFISYCWIWFGEPFVFVQAQKAWSSGGGLAWGSWLSKFVDLTFVNGFSKAFSSMTKNVMVFGGFYLLWRLRAQLSLVVRTYGFCAFGILLASGASGSANRFAYTIISLSIALGLLLSCHPRLGYLIMSFFTVLLLGFTIRFAQGQWVAGLPKILL